MKISKTVWILLGAVAVLLAYLFLVPDSSSVRGTVKWKALENEAIALDIRQGTRTLDLVKSNGIWVFGPRSRRADPEKVGRMLSALTNERSFELVSEGGFLSKFDLEEDKAAEVTLRTPRGERKMRIGKTSSTYSHSFVQLAASNKVYQTSGNLLGDFTPSPEALRDRTVFQFKSEELRSLELRDGKGRSLTAQRTSVPASSNAASRIFWKTAEGKILDETKMASLVDTFTRLNATGFPTNEAAAPGKAFDFQIVAKGATKNVSLTIFPDKQGSDRQALSSDRDDAVLLSESDVDRLAPDLGSLAK